MLRFACGWSLFRGSVVNELFSYKLSSVDVTGNWVPSINSATHSYVNTALYDIQSSHSTSNIEISVGIFESLRSECSTQYNSFVFDFVR